MKMAQSFSAFNGSLVSEQGKNKQILLVVIHMWLSDDILKKMLM